jgi:hypothetical protein
MAKWIEKDVRLAHYLVEGWAGVEGADDGSLTCCHCGCGLIVGAHTSDSRAATLDHIQPRAVTGKARDARKENLIATCARCNSQRQDMDLAVWATRFDAVALYARVGRRVSDKMNKALWSDAVAQARAIIGGKVR